MELYSLFVVDNNEAGRKKIIRSVDWNRLGFTIVGEASSGDEALQGMATVVPDAILTDVQLPGNDGIDLLQYVRTNLPETKVVVLSGCSDFAYMEAAIKNRVDAYLLKPASTELLEETFSSLHKRLDERREYLKERLKLEEMVKESPSYLREKLLAQDRYGSANQKLAERILEYVDREYASKLLSLQSIAKHLQKSPAYISKVFKDVTGENYVRYVSKKRLAKALDLLQNTSLLVYQVTAAVGWTDQSSFIRLFKKQYGFTPSETMRYKAATTDETDKD
ncbi:MAG: helix-turn-helix domain-containing protein [Spirochaetaceae bacterium]|nr:helix-turn-helix domain-containing protein [Spirochaetaceae bacterium]